MHVNVHQCMSACVRVHKCIYALTWGVCSAIAAAQDATMAIASALNPPSPRPHRAHLPLTLISIYNSGVMYMTRILLISG